MGIGFLSIPMNFLLKLIQFEEKDESDDQVD